MEENYLAVLSRFNHQEGYLDLALKGLIKSGLASNGFDGNREQLITILYDGNDNPYLLFNARYFEEVKAELKRRIIVAEGGFKIDSIDSFEKGLNSKIHGKIQKNYTPKLLYTFGAN